MHFKFQLIKCVLTWLLLGKKKSFYKEKGFLFLPGYLIKECSKFF